MSLRIGLIAELDAERDGIDAQARAAAAMGWFAEREVDLVAVDEDPARDRRTVSLTLALHGHAGMPAATVLVAGSTAPDGPLVTNASVATGAPTVVVSGYVRARESRAAGPVLELGQRAGTGEAPWECAMIEIAHAEHGRLWVWREAGRLPAQAVDRDRIMSTMLEAWVFDGSRWQLDQRAACRASSSSRRA